MITTGSQIIFYLLPIYSLSFLHIEAYQNEHLYSISISFLLINDQEASLIYIVLSCIQSLVTSSFSFLIQEEAMSSWRVQPLILLNLFLSCITHKEKIDVPAAQNQQWQQDCQALKGSVDSIKISSIPQLNPHPTLSH